MALGDRPDPIAGQGEVVVEIDAVALNYRDLSIARGTYAPFQPLPMIPASDAAGRIIAVGPGVDRWRVGDRVIGCYMQGWDRGPSERTDRSKTLGSPLDGVLCERRAFPADFIVRAPDRLTDFECATLPVAALTASGIVPHVVPYYSSGLFDEADTADQRAAMYKKYGAHAIDD